MRIFTNTLSLAARTNLDKSRSALGSAIERLSSGLRINSARDDAAGQAIANRMESQIRGKEVAKRNVNDALSLLSTTESAVSEVNSILQRMRELAVHQRTGTLNHKDWLSIQTEIDQLNEEINRIGASSAFGGISLLDVNKELDIQVSSEADESYSIALQALNTKTLGLDLFSPPMGPALNQIVVDSGPNAGTWNLEFEGVIVPEPNGGNYGVVLKPGEAESFYGLEPGSITLHQIYNLDGTPREREYAVKIGNSNYFRAETSMIFNGATGVATYRINNAFHSANIRDPETGLSLDGQSINNAQMGWDKDGNFVQYLEWQGNYIEYKGTGSNHNFYLSGPNKNTIELMQPNILEQVDQAMAQIDKYRTYLGATQNRLESISSGLSSSNVALEAARSRIQDADYAVEVSNMTRAQILQQAGQAVLAQANQIPQGVLSLLQG